MMDSEEFDWDNDNIEHLARHGVEPWEAEEAVRDDSNAFTFPARSGRIGYIGSTEDGRLLGVILERKARRLVRVITAYDAGSRERRIYRRHNR